MYYYKLLRMNQRGELVSPYGHGEGEEREYVWKIGEWRKTEGHFYSSETIVEALSVVWIEHFSVIAIVEIRGDIRPKERIFTEVISKEMRIIKAFLWPERLKLLIEREIRFPEDLSEGFMVVRSSDEFFQNLSQEDKSRWEIFLSEEMKKFVPYGK
jgi:hypothetical protein